MITMDNETNRKAKVFGTGNNIAIIATGRYSLKSKRNVAPRAIFQPPRTTKRRQKTSCSKIQSRFIGTRSSFGTKSCNPSNIGLERIQAMNMILIEIRCFSHSLVCSWCLSNENHPSLFRNTNYSSKSVPQNRPTIRMKPTRRANKTKKQLLVNTVIGTLIPIAPPSIEPMVPFRSDFFTLIKLLFQTLVLRTAHK